MTTRALHVAATLLLVGIVASHSFAQVAQDPGIRGALLDHVTLSQSLDDKNTINKPAFATLTMPDGGASLNSVGAALSVYLLPEATENPKLNLGAGIELDQNSAPKKRQNLLRGAGLFEARRGGDNAGDLFPRLLAKAAYKNDREKHKSGLEATAYLTYEENPPDPQTSSSIPICSRKKPLCAALEYMPRAGLEFDNVISAEHAEDQGKVTRGMVGVNINAFPLILFPVPAGLQNRVVVSAEIDYRYDMQTDFTGSDRRHPFQQVSAKVLFTQFKVFSLSVDRVMGEDPSQNIAGPAFTRLTLNIQIGRTQKRLLAPVVFQRAVHII